MPLEVQAKLLRVLQQRTVRPLGGNNELPFRARIIAATNRDLEAEIDANRFREDLYHRINVVSIKVPPLRERLEDVLTLAQVMLRRTAERLDKPVRGLTRGRRAVDPRVQLARQCPRARELHRVAR